MCGIRSAIFIESNFGVANSQINQTLDSHAYKAGYYIMIRFKYVAFHNNHSNHLHGFDFQIKLTRVRSKQTS